MYTPGSTIDSTIYSRTVLALPRYDGSASRYSPVLPKTSNGPTWPFAPGTPGIV